MHMFFVLGGSAVFVCVMGPFAYVSSLLLSVFSTLLLTLLYLCLCIDRRLNITAEADCRKLHCALRDLSSLLQAVGRLAEFFTGDVFTARFNDALAIVQRSVTLL